MIRQIKKRPELPAIDLAAAGNLRDYYYLTLIVGIGLLISIGLFVAIVRVQYNTMHKEFQVESAMAHTSLDLAVANQIFRLQSIENELEFVPRSKIRSSRLHDLLVQTSFDRLERLRMDDQRGPLQEIWSYSLSTGRRRWRPPADSIWKLRAAVEQLSATDSKSTGVLLTDKDNIELAVVGKILASKRQFFVAYSDAERILFNDSMSVGRRLVIEQNRFADREFVEFRRDSDSKSLLSLSAEDFDLLKMASPFVYSAPFPGLGDSVRLYIFGGQSPFATLGWPLTTLLSSLAITFLIGILVFNLINRNIEIRKQVAQKTLDLEVESHRALQAAEAKNRFLANVSHEVRTPLNLILGMAELLRETQLSEEQNRYVENFSRAGSHLLRLISDILDVARLDATDLRLRCDKVHLLRFFEEIVEFVAPSCEMKGLNLHFQIDPQLKGEAFIDPGRIRQIVLNLFNNSLKFTDRGAITIRVGRSLNTPNGADQIVIVVSDTGIGIPADQIGEIFKEFYQVDASATRSRTGVGLGLSIVNAIVKRLGGDIKVESQVNVGTEIQVTIPVQFMTEKTISEAIHWPEAMPTVAYFLNDERLWQTDFRFLEELGLHGEKLPISVSYLREAREHLARFTHFFVDLPTENRPEWIRLFKEHLPGDVTFVAVTRSQLDAESIQALAEHWKFEILISPLIPTRLLKILGATVKIPVKKIPQPTPSVTGNAQNAIPESMRVLIVEDDLDNRILMQAYLAQLKIRFRFANNGKEALDIIDEDPPSLIVTDLQMPVMDGFTFIEKLREKEAKTGEPSVPIVVLTADAQEESAEIARQLRVDRVLTKPVGKQEFISTLKEFAQPSV